MAQDNESFKALHRVSYPEAFVARASTGMSISAAAAAIGVKRSELGAWEKGTKEAPRDAIDALRALPSSARPQQRSRFTFIDLFAGIGGMRRAFEAAGGSCVLTAEWNARAVETYLANHSCDHPVVGDVTSLAASMVPQHDVLVAGFPCQPFSIAGVSKKNSMGRKHGFADETQGTLFFDVARIIDGVRPRAFVLENVRNLLSHDKGRTFEVIRRVLADELGYALSWRVINAASWVPQRRQRIFIVGVRDGDAFDFDDISVPETQPVMGSVLHRQGEVEDPTFAPGGVPLSKYTLSDGLWSFLKGYADKHKEKGNGFGFGLVGPEDVARTMSARYGKDGSEILVKTASGNPRRLTPRECARLMGFDSTGQRPMVIPVSDAQAYKQFGNSVAVPCVAAVANAVIACLEQRQLELAA
jgi:DNA (cytosine-5)-methyltransferase 1